jgi:hypothetical protein
MRTAEPVSQEKLLIDSWDEACQPLLDDRPEVVALYEERRMEARSALIEYRRRSKGPGIIISNHSFQPSTPR